MPTTILYGATGAIGRALLSTLSANETANEHTSKLHLVARDESELTALASEYQATYTVGDATDPELFKRVAEDIDDAVDGLVYAVGSLNLKPLAKLSATDFDNDFTVNARGAALAVQAHTSQLRKGKGSVVLFSSVAASTGFAFHASIGMAKAAVEGLTAALAAELAPHVRVNAIAPSLSESKWQPP